MGLTPEKAGDIGGFSAPTLGTIQCTKECEDWSFPGYKRVWGKKNGSLLQQQKGRMQFQLSRKNGEEAFQPKKLYKRLISLYRIKPEWTRINTGFSLSQAIAGRKDNIIVSTT